MPEVWRRKRCGRCPVRARRRARSLGAERAVRSVPTNRMAALPTLADLAAQPERVNAIAPGQARAYLAQLVPLQTALLCRAFAQDGSADSRGDRLLSVKEAAAKLGQSVAYVYKHADTFPFTVRNGRALRFSEAGIDGWIRNRQRP